MRIGKAHRWNDRLFFAIPRRSEKDCEQVRDTPSNIRPPRDSFGCVRSKKVDKFRDSSRKKQTGHSAEEGSRRAAGSCRCPNQQSRRERRVAKHLQSNDLENHTRPFGFPSGGDIEEIEVGREGHDSNLGKIQDLLPIDGTGFSLGLR